MSTLRIAIYSHDAMGLGHMRRNLLIAEALAGRDASTHVLLIAGAPELGSFRLPPNVDPLLLPPLSKTSRSEYVPRNSAGSTKDLIALRSNIIRTATREFAPDLLLADKLPRGLLGELDASLRELRRTGATRFVLGMRDILDHPLAVKREWTVAGYDAILRDVYDAIWVYGDPSVYDPRREYKFPEPIASKIRFTGYLNPAGRLLFEDGSSHPEVETAPSPDAVCMVGGGQDGEQLARTFVAAVEPTDLGAVMLTGPFMPAEARGRIATLAAGNPRLRVLDFLRNPGPLLARAGRVVTMGGYNALTESLALGRPTLVVPRVTPRTEQLIRARRFAELGLVDMMHPSETTPESLREWISREPRFHVEAASIVDFGGLDRLPALLDEILHRDTGRETGPATGTGA